MSLFQRLFGGKAAEKSPTPQEAIQKLIEIEELLRKRQDVLEAKIEEELKTAKLNGVKNKRCNSIIYLFGSSHFILKLVFFNILFNFTNSGFASVKAKEETGESIESNRRNVDHIGESTRDAGERQHQHRGLEDHEPGHESVQVGSFRARR